MYHPWYDYVKIGNDYTQIGYSQKYNMIIFYQDIYFQKFKRRFTEGDVVKGNLVYNNGKYIIAIAAGYPCYVNGRYKNLPVGRDYNFTISIIDDSYKKVILNLLTND